jgi:hypothetical protein
MLMNLQPSFTTPNDVIAFFHKCLEQNDPDMLFAAILEETSDFWKERIFQGLRAIEQSETLERVFLEDRRITDFPRNEHVLHLGGHNPRTQHLNVRLEKIAGEWVLASMQVVLRYIPPDLPYVIIGGYL